MRYQRVPSAKTSRFWRSIITHTSPSESSPRTLRGACLCGNVHIEVKERIAYAGFCHCTDCQRQTGSAFTMSIGVRCEDLCITAGEESIRSYRKSAQTVLNFCGNCGSQLFAAKPLSGVCHVRVGVLTDKPAFDPMAHVFTASKSAWLEIGKGLPEFPHEPPALAEAKSLLMAGADAASVTMAMRQDAVPGR